jgi:hypothetical protein
MVAKSWLAFTVHDVAGILAVRQIRRGLPDGHPAGRPLEFLSAWTTVEQGVERADRAIGPLLESCADDARWLRMSRFIRGVALLLEQRYREAIDEMRWTAVDDGPDAHYARPMLAIACHLDGRLDDVSALRGAIEASPWPPAQFSDLSATVVAIADHVGRQELPQARTQLGVLIERIDSDYAAVPIISGFIVEMGAVVAEVSGQPNDAVALHAGSRHLGIFRRFEGARALGDHYAELASHQLTPGALADARARGIAMTVTQLTDHVRQLASHTPSEP